MWCYVTRPTDKISGGGFFLFLGAVELGGCQSLNKGSFGAFKRSFNTKGPWLSDCGRPDWYGAHCKLVERFEVWPRRLFLFPWLVGLR